ncbi:hypothetical protein Nepgr_003122 [Nepenthes gracilis]|uniref:Pentatricopeptide repeat-containing protein n=1 Tax=Nepenthes gracilis TaxID=150966 RepID=A0AAD3RYX8_NEPGR|nr:hypothetical protein Nepgr_003122 [Nepenthes gracilis]
MFRRPAVFFFFFVASVGMAELLSTLLRGRGDATSTSAGLQINKHLRAQSIVYSPIIEYEFKENGLLNGFSIDKLVKKHVDNGCFYEAIRVYLDMIVNNFANSEFSSFSTLVKAVGELGDGELGRQVHGHLLKFGVLDNIDVSNSLLSMLWKCGAIDDAVRSFEKMLERDPISWNTMITGFHQTMQYADSLEWFRRMLLESKMYPNRIACVSALSSCASIGCLIRGLEIHAHVLKSGLVSNQLVVNGLLDMYMKLGNVRYAELVFNGILKNIKYIVSWNVMILGFANNGYFLQASLLFFEMIMSGIEPDSSTMVATLVLCSLSLNLGFGRQIHAIIVRIGLEVDVRVQTALIDMYFNCGDTSSGLKLFRRSQNRNLVMWGTVISNCARNDYSREALDLYSDFRLEHGCVDSVILLAALRACSSLNLKSEGMEIHGLVMKLGLDFDMYIGGALVDMYMKAKDVESAQKVFLRVPVRDVISWNALISGYSQNECLNEVLKAFHDMQSQQIRPNAVTMSCILSVCSHASINFLCKEIHGFIIRQGFETNVLVSNSLIVAYAKCGNIKSSQTVFDKMNERDEVSWNSIILGLGIHGNTDEQFALLEKMKEAGMKPDHMTFTSILSACSHTRRLEEGWRYFRGMIEEHKLKPELEQYTCMVDLLGRSGYLDEACDLIMEMPLSPDDRIWGSLLGSCKIHGNKRLAELVSDHIFELNPGSTGYRVLLANLYDDLGKKYDDAKIRSDIKGMGLKKSPGCSWIEVNNQGIYSDSNLSLLLKETRDSVIF